MKSKIFTLTSTNINNNVENEVDISLLIDSYIANNGNSIDENKSYYPSQVFISNLTGVTMGYVLLSPNEDSIYTQKPEWYDFIPIENNNRLSITLTANTKKIIFKKESGTATASLKINCIGYRP